ncbi:MAG: trypsin-like serine protease [Polyangia bacterium]
MKPRALIVATAVAIAGCASGGADVGRAAEAIVGGTSEGVPSAVVLLTYRDRACSGVLVAPRLVATARHCVSDVDPAPFACDERGRAIGAGGGVLGDRDPSQLHVQVGADTYAVDAVFHDGAAHLCAHDVAVVQLHTDAGAMPASLRVGRGVDAGEWITAAGFGLDDAGQLPAAPRERTVEALRIGPVAAGAARAVAPDELETGEGGCGGDSGGPAFSMAGAVVAIYSRGGNDAPGCSGPGARNVYAMSRALEAPLARALLATGAAVTGEDGATLGAAELSSPRSAGCAFAARPPERAPLVVLLAGALLATRPRARRDR